MLPSLSTTTLPWLGPITDLPSGPRPQPGTVSNVISPQPIRTGPGVSAARTDSVRQRTTARAPNRKTRIHDENSLLSGSRPLRKPPRKNHLATTIPEMTREGVLCPSLRESATIWTGNEITDRRRQEPG